MLLLKFVHFFLYCVLQYNLLPYTHLIIFVNNLCIYLLFYFFSLARQSGETYNSLYLKVYTTNLRRLEGASDRQSIIDRLATSRFMSLLPYDYFNYVFSRNPKTGRKAADFATEFAQTRSLPSAIITLALVLITLVLIIWVLIMLMVVWLASDCSLTLERVRLMMTLTTIIIEVSMYLLVLSLRVCSLVVIANKNLVLVVYTSLV